MHRAWRVVACGSTGAAMLVVMSASRLVAQERLVGQQSFGIGASAEAISFGGNGLLQRNFVGLDSARIQRVSQLSTPITTAWTLGSSWRVDVTALYSKATLRYRDAGKPNDSRTATLSGISDVRLRGTGTLINDLLVVTAGLNVPTGHTSLTTPEFGVLRIVAAPGLGLGSAPVGAGASGTLGLVMARKAGEWALALGGSYEYRGSYQPIAALVAGAPSVNFQPGGVVRASVTGDRTVGPHRLSVALAADVFANDELRTPSTSGSASNPTSASGTGRTIVRLGPVVSTDVQMIFAIPQLRQLLAYSSFRWRAPFSRNGSRVTASSGQYLDSGVRAAKSLGPQRDLILAFDTRLHGGLGVDEGLPTAGVASGSLSAGIEVRRGLLAIQPYLRGQAGSLHQRGTSSLASQSFTGFAAGLVAVTRF